MNTYELNFDGLVGPTHHYAGLSLGNLASTSHARQISNPKAAALQGLEKIQLLINLGIKQAILPPQPRPNLHLLHKLGFTGTPEQQISKAYKEAPHILSAAYSASSMWTANAATVTPSIDTDDHKVHFTPANLVSNLHREQESYFTAQILQQIFNNPNYFIHHPVLPKSKQIGDEGAANHTRLCAQYDSAGIHIMTYNKQAFNYSNTLPQKFPGRQTLEASEAIIRSHNIPNERTLFVQQLPKSVDNGVFHNDVIAVGNENLLFLHEYAWQNQTELLIQLQKKCDFELHVIEIANKIFSVKEAVASYVFNSQLVTLPSGDMTLILPEESRQNPKVYQFLNEIICSDNNPIQSMHFIDLKQSMNNGGGPACLRLRVILTEEEIAHIHQPILLTNERIAQLQIWINKYYRDSLSFDDLRDPSLINESYEALEALAKILKLEILM